MLIQHIGIHTNQETPGMAGTLMRQQGMNTAIRHHISLHTTQETHIVTDPILQVTSIATPLMLQAIVIHHMSLHMIHTTLIATLIATILILQVTSIATLLILQVTSIATPLILQAILIHHMSLHITQVTPIKTLKTLTILKPAILKAIEDLIGKTNISLMPTIQISIQKRKNMLL